MAGVLLTAFEPYDHWETNASGLALAELRGRLEEQSQVVTRIYPVDFAAVEQLLADDLEANYDFALHLGQAPGLDHVELEAFAINVRGESGRPPEHYGVLSPDGPAAYRSRLGLGPWVETLRARGIAARVSYHAGTYLCNAVLYWTHYFAERNGHRTRAAMVHLPLDRSQLSAVGRDMPSLSAITAAAAVEILVDELLAFEDSAPAGPAAL